MSTGTNLNYTFGVPPGNTLLLTIQVVDFSGNILLNTSLSSIQLNIYAPGSIPTSPNAIPLATIIPTAFSGSYWSTYYTVPLYATIGTYIVQIEALTISSFQLTDYSKFRTIPIDW